jgi:hypothetical protein
MIILKRTLKNMVQKVLNFLFLSSEKHVWTDISSSDMLSSENRHKQTKKRHIVYTISTIDYEHENES